MAQATVETPRPSVRLTRRQPVIEITPLEGFAHVRRFSAAETRSFLKFVEDCDGSFYTDIGTLYTLYGIWKEKGKP